MKALSIRAPWWFAILHFGKDIENRTWATNFRGTVYLHAGKWFEREEVVWDLEDIHEMRLQATGNDGALHVPLDAVRAAGGCIVGMVDVVDCVTQSKSPWFVGAYGFVLRNPIALPKPIPFKGALGFFDVPDGVVRL